MTNAGRSAITAEAVPTEAHCITCGYALRGLSVRSVCPECATPVGQSLIAFGHPAQVRRGCQWCGGGYLLTAVPPLLPVGQVMRGYGLVVLLGAARLWDDPRFRRPLSVALAATLGEALATAGLILAVWKNSGVAAAALFITAAVLSLVAAWACGVFIGTAALRRHAAPVHRSMQVQRCAILLIALSVPILWPAGSALAFEALGGALCLAIFTGWIVMFLTGATFGDLAAPLRPRPERAAGRVG